MKNLLLLNMGLPMILPSLALMVVALVPVVLVETLLTRSLLRTNFKRTVLPVFVANLISTFIGIPVTWFLLTVLEFVSVPLVETLTKTDIWTRAFSVTLGAPWVAPGHDDEQWIILGAMLFLLIPYGIVSWLVEFKIVQGMLVGKTQSASEPEGGPHKSVTTNHLVTPRQTKRAVGVANLVSYCLLAVLVILTFASQYR